MKPITSKIGKRDRRHARIRAKISGTSEMPRLSVFKSNKYISAQIIDDVKGITLASVHSKDIKAKTMQEKAEKAGVLLAEGAKLKKIEKVVFDRGGFIYTGNVKALADGARKGGLQF
ncbi:MAG TPA: 50S ribosomal protein L18 [Candidatus Paceibacterota bacterium]